MTATSTRCSLKGSHTRSPAEQSPKPTSRPLPAIVASFTSRNWRRSPMSNDFPKSAPTAKPVFFRTYSRHTSTRRETWEQTVERSLRGLVELGNLTETEEALLKRMMLGLSGAYSSNFNKSPGSHFRALQSFSRVAGVRRSGIAKRFTNLLTVTRCNPVLSTRSATSNSLSARTAFSFHLIGIGAVSLTTPMIIPLSQGLFLRLQKASQELLFYDNSAFLKSKAFICIFREYFRSLRGYTKRAGSLQNDPT